MKEIENLPELDFEANIGLPEAVARLDQVREVFSFVRGKYPTEVKDHSLVMDEGDIKTLSACVGVLIPLSTMSSVQQENRLKVNGNKSVYDQTEELYLGIFNFAVGFTNTGITRTHDGGFIY